MSEPRDVTMHVYGVQFIVTLYASDEHHPRPSRVSVRLAGRQQDIARVLAEHVLEEIDRRIATGKLPEPTLEDTIPFGHTEPPELVVELASIAGIPIPHVTVKPRGVDALFDPDGGAT